MVPGRFLATLLALALTAPPAAARQAAPLAAQSPQVIDLARRVDLNQLNMWNTNFGSVAWDLATGNAGLEFPRGSGKTVLFAGGLWLGAEVGGQTRVTVAEYSQEYGPGPITGGTHANPALPQFKVYKVLSWTGNPADTGHVDRASPGAKEDPLAHHSWSEYMSGAAPYGAPWQFWLLPDPQSPGNVVIVPGPADLAGQIQWAVYNDADPALHVNDAGGSTPLGVEIQQTTLAWGHPEAAQAVILRYRLIHKGTQPLSNMVAAFWTDPDLGGATDDLIGSDEALELVYAYNATNSDLQYGATPPAVGVTMLKGPQDALGDSIPAAAAVRFINGTDPGATPESWNYMHGLHPDGSPMIDPGTNQPATFWFDGEPAAGTGWLDAGPGDRRMMLSSGTFDMAPGDTQEVVFAIAVGQGSDRLSSINVLKANVHYLRTGMSAPPPPPAQTNCPRPVAFWATECGPSSGVLTPAEFASVASAIGAQSLLFDWSSGTETSGLCAVLAPPGPIDLRSQAKSEYAALLANWAAGPLGLSDSGDPIRLLENMPVQCAGVPAVTLGQLVATASATPYLEVTYENDNTANRRALTGVDWGGASFFGGADFAWQFGSVGPDPATQPDSFVTVEIRFSQTVKQKGYRYLRLEQPGGAAPAGGREYRYGGFHDVPFTAWDVENNVQLDVAFLERTITDAAGTIQPPGAQLAAHDSTWGPTADPLGDREYLMILTRPYSPTPKAELTVDGKFFDSAMPGMYAVWAALRTPGDVIDDGDRMLFRSAPYSGPGVDTQLLNLEGQPLANTLVQEAYQQIIDCLRGINEGVTIENPCSAPTSTLVALVSADANTDRVDLTWYTTATGLSVEVERSAAGGPWLPLGGAKADGTGSIRFTDSDITPGQRYRYRLGFVSGGQVVYTGETEVLVPATLQLALSGFVPNPARGRPVIEFVLPIHAPARLDVLDLQGRRVWHRDVGSLGPGRVTVPVEGGTLRPGIYVVRLEQQGVAVTRKAVLVR